MSVQPAEDNDFEAAEVTGYFHTEGAQIVDENGQAVQLVGANWFGAEGANRIPNGLWARNYQDMMNQMVESGINVIRLPVSPDILDPEPVSDGLYDAINPDLVGLSGIEVVDKIVEYAGEIGVRIILDMHRIDSGVGKQETGLWHSEDYSIEDLAADWQTIASRYAGDATVIGADVFNEPSGDAHWGETDKPAENDWHAASEYLGNAILEANPDLLILVQGVHIVNDKWYWVGGNLSAAGEIPVELDVDGRLVYSPHDYPYSVQNVPWLDGATPEDMRALFQKHWGYLAEQDIAPILVGETGGKLKQAEDAVYLDTLFDYLDTLGGGSNVTWWGWNPNSHDTGGLLGDDWNTVDTDKLDYLHSLGPTFYPATQAAHDYLTEGHETLTIDFGDTKAHDRVFTLTIDGMSADGQSIWSEDLVVQVPAGETSDTLDLFIPAELRNAVTDLEIDMFYVSGGLKASYDVALAPRPEPLPEPEPAPETPTEIPAVEEPATEDTPQDPSLNWFVEDVTGGLADGKTASVGAVYDATVKEAPVSLALSVETFFDDLSLSSGYGGHGVDPLLIWSTDGLGAGGMVLDGDAQDRSDVLSIRSEIKEQWGDHILGRIHIENTSDTDIETLELELEAHGLELTAIHKMDGRLHSDGGAWIAAPDWMRGIDAGETISFGFSARMTGETTPLLEEAIAEVTREETPPNIGLLWDGAEDGLGGGVIVLKDGTTDLLNPNAETALNLEEVKVWGDTFQIRLGLTNTTGAALEDWELDLDGLGFSVTEVNNVGAWESLNGGDSAHISAPDWNRTLEAGETAYFSVKGELDPEWLV